MNSSYQQAIIDIENQYTNPRYWNIKIPGQPDENNQEDRSCDVMRKYFTDPKEPWNQKKKSVDFETKPADSPYVDPSTAILKKYFTNLNEPWNKRAEEEIKLKEEEIKSNK